VLRSIREGLLPGLSGTLFLLAPLAHTQESGDHIDPAQTTIARSSPTVAIDTTGRVEANRVGAARSKPPEPLLGAGHAAWLELTTIDTRTAQLNHSLGGGTFGTVSYVVETPASGDPSAHVVRFLMDWHVAGGESGFDGLLHIDLGHGRRWPAYGHGFVLRGGADLKLAGNQRYYLSAFNAPNLDAGYQYMDFGKLLELSFRTSVLWDGRFRTDAGPSENLPTAVGWGGLLDAGTRSFWMSMQFLHGGGVSQLNADLCSKPRVMFSLCVRLAHATDGWPGSEPGRHVTTGTFGIGLSPP
jgi:hypothetical protein